MNAETKLSSEMSVLDIAFTGNASFH